MVEEIREKIENWKSTDNFKRHLKELPNKEKELNDFLSTFTKDKVKTMTLDEYVTGKANSKSFCNWIEYRLSFYGAISGRTTAYQKYVIYWDKTVKKYLFGDKRCKKRAKFGGGDINVIFDNVKKSILGVIDATEKGDYEKIESNPLNNMVKNKISFLYDSNNQLPIYGVQDINTLLTIFGITFSPTLGTFFKRKLLFDFYKSNLSDLLDNPALFIDFIYNDYGYRNDLPSKNKEKNLVINTGIDKTYYAIEIDVGAQIVRKGASGTRGLYHPDPQSEKKKKETGSNAEHIALDYLRKNANSFHGGIKEIYAWCEHNDSKGYDISYKRCKDDVEEFIEVKGTIRNLKDEVYFEMSSNEYKTMVAHPDTYFIFFINDVSHGDEIKIISAKQLINKMEPIKFKANFIGVAK